MDRDQKKKLFRDCREISLELFEAQKKLRVLSLVNLPPELGEAFLAGRDIQPETAKVYAERRARSHARQKIRELIHLRSKTHRRLCANSDLCEILDGRIHDYLEVGHLLQNAGKPEFGEISAGLWGSSRDILFSDGTTVAAYARRLQSLIEILTTGEDFNAHRVLPAEAVAELMRAHFRQVHLAEHISIVVTDKITANASAGNGKIKLRKGARFSAKDVQVLIHHEAFTHVITASNGHSQPYAKFLGFDSPRCTSTQEGLAVLMEIFSNSTYPQRILKIADRVIGVSLAEEGGGPRDVFEYYRGRGYKRRESFQLMSRVFRGTDFRPGNAFTKDVAYLKGLIECFNFIQFCLVRNHTESLPLLFAGKLHVREVPALCRLHEMGLLKSPKWIPAQFQDVDALSSWFVCASAFGQMGDIDYHERFAASYSEHLPRNLKHLVTHRTVVAKGDRAPSARPSGDI